MVPCSSGGKTQAGESGEKNPVGNHPSELNNVWVLPGPTCGIVPGATAGTGTRAGAGAGTGVGAGAWVGGRGY